MDKNIVLKSRNTSNTDWDNIFPITKATNVFAEDDKNFEELIAEKVNKTDLSSTDLNKGASQIGLHDAGGNFVSSNVEGALAELSEREVGIERAYGESSYYSAMAPGEIKTMSHTIPAGKEYFNVLLQGSDVTSFGDVNYLPLTVGVRVHGKSGQDGYHQCVGSTAVSPTATVTDRNTIGSAWTVGGIDATSYSDNNNNPIIGEWAASDSNFIFRGCGMFKNYFYSCISSSLTLGNHMKLLGIYISGTTLNLVFKNDHPNTSIPLKTKISWEVW